MKTPTPYIPRVPKSKPVSSAHFLHRVRDYLPMDADIRATDGRGRVAGSVLAEGPRSEVFHLWDAEAVLAVSHAIEELALEHAHGRLVACMQDFACFDPHRERYWQLAATLDEVCVIARGRRRPPHDHLRFCPSANPAILPFWGVVYSSRGLHLGFLGRQTGGGERFEGRRFLGFYTLDPGIVGRLLADLQSVGSNRAPVLAEFERLRRLDLGAKRVREEFAREQSRLSGLIEERRFQPGKGDGLLGRALGRSVVRLRRLNDGLLAAIDEPKGLLQP